MSRRDHALQFQIMSPDEIRGQSVVEVTKTVLSMTSRGDSCLDNKMGCIGPKEQCGTCGKPMNTCNGHFGHIELGAFLFHPFFINEVFRTMKFSCPLCCAYYPKKQRDCVKCNSIMGTWSRKLRRRDKFGIRDKFEYTYTERQTGYTKVIKPVTSVIHEILKQVNKENLLLSVLPVAPLCVRPTISMLGSSKHTYDPLTLSYVLVVRESSMLKTFLKYHQAPHIIKHQWRRTQDAVYQIYDTSRLSDNGQGVQGIRQRLDGKQGRFRQNLLGKRVDYCARTVITADPSLDLDQIGVPQTIAMRLTKSVVVTPFNISIIRKMIRIGPNEIGGALYVTSANGKIEYDLAFVQSIDDVASRIGYGDIVDRMLVDDDWVAINRQPSLHKMSLMGHRVKILDYSTFRLNLSVTSPYNADFDGDEMNLHVPQSLAADVEVSNLMSVTNCLLSPANNKPVMGIIQDSLLGAYKLSSPNTFIDKWMCFDMIHVTLGDAFDGNIPPPTVVTEEPKWSGVDMLSLLFPDNFFLELPSVSIRHGHIVRGRLCKKSLGRVEGGIIHRMALHYGNERTCRFMTEIQRMTNYYLTQASFSTGISDCVLEREPMMKINEQLEHVITTTNNPYLEESLLNRALNQARDVASKTALESLDPETHGMLAMASAGSKGSNINIAQITTCVGQQNVNGQRLNPGDSGRTMPHFSKCDFDPRTRGFCRNSYLKGLTPYEFFAHMQGGREGLIDTACKTADTGYLERQLVKASENLSVAYDNTVRDAQNRVVQFRYGDDGFDATRLIRILPGEGDCGNLSRKQLYPSPIDFPHYMLQIPKCRKLQHHQPEVWVRVDTVIKYVSENPINDVLGSLCRSYLKTDYYFRYTEDKWILWLCDTVVDNYDRNMVHPGEMVGVLAAQSIAEPATQMTLNTFHFAGVSAKNVTLGIPRLKELFHASKKIKTPNVMFRCSEPNLKIEPQTCIEDITSSICLSYALPDTKWVRRWCTVFRLSDAMLLERNWVVIRFIDSVTECTLAHARDAISEGFADENVVLIPTHYTDEDHPSLVVHFADETQELYSFKLWNNIQKTLLSMYLYGILNKNAVATYENGWYSLGDTSLTRAVLRAIVDLSENDTSVDVHSVTSNNPRDILEIFGIEAARTTLIKELSDVLKFDGTYVNKRHPLLLVDAMTKDGTIQPMNRSGIKKNASALSFASFEMATVSLAEAAMQDRVDPMKGVAERIIVGQMANIGTNANVELFLNEEMLEHSFNLVEDAEEADKMGFVLPSVFGSPPLDTSPSLSDGQPSQFSPAWGATFSPDQTMTTSDYSPEQQPYVPSSPMYSPTTPCYSPDQHDIYAPPSPAYAPATPEHSPPELDAAVNSLFT